MTSVLRRPKRFGRFWDASQETSCRMCLPQGINIAGVIGELQARHAIDSYSWIQQNVTAQMGAGTEFGRRFNRFYRVRRGATWQAHFYDYFGELRDAQGGQVLPAYQVALAEVQRRTGRIEASFTSKMLATLDPSRAVLDRNVLRILNLRLPHWYQRDRIQLTSIVFDQVTTALNAIRSCPQWRRAEQQFDEAFPGVGITPMKKLDFFLWAGG